ncbi:MAG: DUF445 family protein [Sedimentibacter sp.]|uniref:DUF445 family protein n=1 Tax=Sedimentibacter sp. TaxID=1960295 RepID=UPI0031594C50
MSEILQNYIAQAILGGAAGYITNDYAINMLFKEYTPLKIGGVIKKTREEFIDNLSTMVENDIVNKEKIHEILLDEKFREKFNMLTDDFLRSSLYESAGSTKFEEVPGFDETLEKSMVFISKLTDDNIKQLTDFIIDSMDAEDFFTEPQLEKISGSLLSLAEDTLKNTEIPDTFLFSLYCLMRDYSLNELVKDSGKLSSVLSENVIVKLVEIMKKYNLHDQAADGLKLKTAIHEARNIFYQRRLKSIVSEDFPLQEVISRKLLEYVESENGQRHIQSLCSSIFDYGKKCDKSIFDLLDASFEENLKNQIKESIPPLTAKAVKWLEENSRSIDKLLEDSIDEVIKESDGLKGKLLSTIKNTYFGNLSRKYSIVQKIISFVEKIANPEKLSDAISAKVTDLLSSLSLREITDEAERNGIDDKWAAKFASDYLQNNIEGFVNEALTSAGNLHIGDIAPDFTLEKMSLTGILTSDYALSMAKDKLTHELNTLLFKKISELADEKTAKNTIINARPHFAEYIAKSPSAVTWIQTWVSEAAAHKQSLKNNEVYERVSGEIKNSLKTLTANAGSIKVSEAVDRVNSIDKLSENSSEALRKYAVNNTDTILKGSIKGIVSSNLNRLNDDELVGFANEFIGRELKPIMFFGGLLGAAAGLILAAVQGSPADPGRTDASAMATYSFVGLITNVLAINMLFRPYREIKILSKIPLLKNFSQGFIVKNQKSFARSTASFIDKSLLSQESINRLFDEYQDSIREGFIKNAAENNYETAINLLTNNRDSITRGICGFTKEKAKENEEKIAYFISEKAGNLRLSDILTQGVVQNISDEACEFFLGDKPGRMAYAHIRSLKIENVLPADAAENYMRGAMEKYFKAYRNFISDSSNLRNLASKHQDAYIRYTNRSIKDILGAEKSSNLADAAGEKLKSLVLSKTSRDRISQGAVNLFNRLFDKDKEIKDLFDGRFKGYLDQKLPTMLEKLFMTVKHSIKDNKGRVSAMVQAEIKNSLGFLERGMYTFMGGDAIVDELMKKIFDEKLPVFLDEKKDELYKIAASVIEEKFYRAKVGILHKSVNKVQIGDMVDRYLDEGNSEKIGRIVSRMASETFKRESERNLNDTLRILSLNDMNTIFNSYGAEIDAFLSSLSSLTEEDFNTSANKIISALSSEICDMKFEELLNGIPEEDASEVFSSLFAALEKDGGLKKAVSDSIMQTAEHIKSVKLSDITDQDELRSSVYLSLAKLLDSSGADNVLKDAISSIIDEAAKHNFAFADEKTKEYLLNVFVDASISSLKNNLDDILKAVQFDRIAREEIENMEPRKIHEMFNSFGEKYFCRLMLYGLGGFVFGINMYVGFGLTALKSLSGLFRKGE